MHELHTTTEAPINIKAYRYPESLKKVVDEQIETMLDQGIIRPSTSAWKSPIWVVPKKADADGNVKYRVVIDYRKLNSVTIGDSYPIPNIEEILDQLGHSNYFTTLDLKSGFHQIKIDLRDAHKTAFQVNQGFYEFTKMPFGLKNAPATFQRLMNFVLSGLQNTSRALVSLDDIIIFSGDLKTHRKINRCL